MMFSEIIAMTKGITIDHLLRAFEIYKTSITLNPVILKLTVTGAYMMPLVNVPLSNGMTIKQIISVIGETELDAPEEVLFPVDGRIVCEDNIGTPSGGYCFVSDSISAISAVVNVVCHVYPKVTITNPIVGSGGTKTYTIDDYHVFPVLAKAMSIMTMELGDIVGSGAYEKFYINLVNYLNMNMSKPGNTGISYMEIGYGLQ